MYLHHPYNDYLQKFFRSIYPNKSVLRAYIHNIKHNLHISQDVSDRIKLGQEMEQQISNTYNSHSFLRILRYNSNIALDILRMYVSSIISYKQEFLWRGYFLDRNPIFPTSSSSSSKSSSLSSSSLSHTSADFDVFPNQSFHLSSLPLNLPVCLSSLLRASLTSSVIECVFILLSEKSLPSFFIKAFLVHGINSLSRSLNSLHRHQRITDDLSEQELTDDETFLFSSFQQPQTSTRGTSHANIRADLFDSHEHTSESHRSVARNIPAQKDVFRSFSLFIQNLLCKHHMVLDPAQNHTSSDTELIELPLDDWFFDTELLLQLEEFALQIVEYDSAQLYQKIKSYSSVIS